MRKILGTPATPGLCAAGQSVRAKASQKIMSRAVPIMATLAIGVLGTQSAKAGPMVVANFDPLTQETATYTVDDLTSDTETITVNIVGFSSTLLGTFGLNEEAPFGTFGSDQITISNSGPNGSGLIDVISGDLPRLGTTCASGDEASNQTCIFNLPLAGSNISLNVTFTSFVDDTGPDSLSDVLTITRAPEPASLALLGFGLTALGLIRRKRG